MSPYLAWYYVLSFSFFFCLFPLLFLVAWMFYVGLVLLWYAFFFFFLFSFVFVGCATLAHIFPTLFCPTFLSLTRDSGRVLLVQCLISVSHAQLVSEFFLTISVSQTQIVGEFFSSV